MDGKRKKLEMIFTQEELANIDYIASLEEKSNTEKNLEYSLNFLAWVNRCLFIDDFISDLKTLNVDKEVVADFIFAIIHTRQPLDIMSIYQSLCVGCSEYTSVVVAYLESQLEKYKTSK